MAGSSVLREFVIKLGFKQDEQQYRNFQNNLQNIVKSAVELSKAFVKTGEGVAVGLGAVGVALAGISKGMAGLYYSAQRTGSSAKDLDQLSYAFQQIGLSAEDAESSVESLAAARRNNPGLNGLLGSITGDPNQTNNSKAFIELMAQLRQQAPQIATQYAAMFGISDNVLTQLRNNGPEFSGAMVRRQQQYIKDGYDPNAAAQKAVEFQRHWDDMLARWQGVAVKASDVLLPAAERMMGWIDRLAGLIGSVDKATGGWATNLIAVGASLRLAGLASKLLTGNGLTGILKGVGKLLGGGATAAAEGAGAIAGEGAAGAGVLALLPELLPFIIAAVAVSAIAWMVMHPQQVGKAAAWVGHKAQDAGHAIASGAVKSAHWVMSGITSMTAHFEGYRDKVYKDIAGHQTIFYGHLLRAGETVQGLMKEGPAAVLARDLKDAAASVAKLVKVHLSNNQAQALSDLVFNVGAQKFAHSTLLRKLNSGDYAGAADQFQYWNKALVNGHMMAVQGLTNRRASEANLFRTGDKPVTISQKSDFHISSTDPQGAASEVDRRQRAANADLVRNFAGAIQ
jgi:lysozyme